MDRLQLSSFQLEDVHTLACDVAVLLNLEPDHFEIRDSSSADFEGHIHGATLERGEVFFAYAGRKWLVQSEPTTQNGSSARQLTKAASPARQSPLERHRGRGASQAEPDALRLGRVQIT